MTSVVVKKVAVIDGKEYPLTSTDFTASVSMALKDGYVNDNPTDIIEYITNPDP